MLASRKYSVLLLCGKNCAHTKHKKLSAGKVFCSSQGWTHTNTGYVMRYCMDIHFCALANNNTAVVRIKCFAPLNVGHVHCATTVSLMCNDV